MPKSGKMLEKLMNMVELVYKSNPETQILRNYKIPNSSGNLREFDVFIISKLNGYPIHIAIECKDYKRKVETGKIEAFHAKCQRIPNINKKVFVSSAGFQKDAIDAAKEFGIDLFTFGEIETNPKEAFLPLTIKKLNIASVEAFIIQIKFQNAEDFKEINSSDINISFGKKKDYKIEQIAFEVLKRERRKNYSLAVLNYLKTESFSQRQIHKIDCQGAFFEYKGKKIFIDEIECEVIFKLELKDFPVSFRELKNLEDNSIKAKSGAYIINEKLEGNIIIDDKENLHFFDTSEDQIKEMKLLFTIDKDKNG